MGLCLYCISCQRLACRSNWGEVLAYHRTYRGRADRIHYLDVNPQHSWPIRGPIPSGQRLRRVRLHSANSQHVPM